MKVSGASIVPIVSIAQIVLIVSIAPIVSIVSMCDHLAMFIRNLKIEKDQSNFCVTKTMGSTNSWRRASLVD